MKLSLKLRDETNQNPLIRAKVPVTILGSPFLSGVVAGDASDLSFSLRTNFSSGPSLAVSYHPVVSYPVATTTATVPSSTSAAYPFSLSLKSGIGVYGSPRNSPLVFTARFNLLSTSNSTSNPTLTPAFSLLVKPQFGNFSLRKSTSSCDSSPVILHSSRSNPDLPNGSAPITDSGNGFSLDRPLQWKDLKAGARNRVEISGMLSGIFVTAKTTMPLTKRTVVNCRWGVNFPPERNELASKLSRPMLVLNKIGIERVEEVKMKKEVELEEKKKINGDSADLELMKSTCAWMGREMGELQRQNRDIIQAFEGVRSRSLTVRTRGEEKESVGMRGICTPPSGPKASSTNGSGSGFERWKSHNSPVEENGRKDSKNSPVMMTEMESELQKAIKASTSSSSS